MHEVTKWHEVRFQLKMNEMQIYSKRETEDEADKKALQSIVENNAEGQALYRDLSHDFAHHADVFQKPLGFVSKAHVMV